MILTATPVQIPAVTRSPSLHTHRIAMLYSSAFLAIAAMTGLVAGQISIDPNSVPADERAGWCNAERNTCPLICDQNVANNTCDPVSSRNLGGIKEQRF